MHQKGQLVDCAGQLVMDLVRGQAADQCSPAPIMLLLCPSHSCLFASFPLSLKVNFVQPFTLCSVCGPLVL